jgi:hypothetical protein
MAALGTAISILAPKQVSRVNLAIGASAELQAVQLRSLDTR